MFWESFQSNDWPLASVISSSGNQRPETTFSESWQDGGGDLFLSVVVRACLRLYLQKCILWRIYCTSKVTWHKACNNSPIQRLISTLNTRGHDCNTVNGKSCPVCKGWQRFWGIHLNSNSGGSPFFPEDPYFHDMLRSKQTWTISNIVVLTWCQFQFIRNINLLRC